MNIEYRSEARRPLSFVMGAVLVSICVVRLSIKIFMEWIPVIIAIDKK